MPVLQWSLLFVLSLLLSLLFLLIHLPGPLLLGSMIVGIIFSLRGISLHPPRCTFLGAQAILGCMIAQNLTGSIFTTLAAHWPMVIVILLATLISSAIIGWLLVRYSNLPGNTGAWGSSPGGAAAMVAQRQWWRWRRIMVPTSDWWRLCSICVYCWWSARRRWSPVW